MTDKLLWTVVPVGWDLQGDWGLQASSHWAFVVTSSRTAERIREGTRVSPPPPKKEKKKKEKEKIANSKHANILAMLLVLPFN
jgi:hypothetical protein